MKSRFARPSVERLEDRMTPSTLAIWDPLNTVVDPLVNDITNYVDGSNTRFASMPTGGWPAVTAEFLTEGDAATVPIDTVTSNPEADAELFVNWAPGAVQMYWDVVPTREFIFANGHAITAGGDGDAVALDGGTLDLSGGGSLSVTSGRLTDDWSNTNVVNTGGGASIVEIHSDRMAAGNNTGLDKCQAQVFVYGDVEVSYEYWLNLSSTGLMTVFGGGRLDADWTGTAGQVILAADAGNTNHFTLNGSMDLNCHPSTTIGPVMDVSGGVASVILDVGTVLSAPKGFNQSGASGVTLEVNSSGQDTRIVGDVSVSGGTFGVYNTDGDASSGTAKVTGDLTITGGVLSVDSPHKPGNNPSTLQVGGDFTVGASGEVDVGVSVQGMTSAYADKIQVTGTASLNGTIQLLVWRNGLPFVMTHDAGPFVVLTAASVSGTSTVSNGPTGQDFTGSVNGAGTEFDLFAS